MILRRLVLVLSLLVGCVIAGMSQGWERVYPAFAPQAYAVKTMPLPDGNLLSLVSENAGPADFHLLRLDATGLVIQQVPFDFLAAERALDLTALPDGGWAVLYEQRINLTKKHFILRLDTQFNILWNQALEPADNLIYLTNLLPLGDGFLVYGSRQIAAGTYQYISIRTDAAGLTLQSEQWGTEYCNPAGLEMLDDGSFIAGGYNYSPFTQPANARVNLARLSADGALLNTATINTGVATAAWDMCLSAAGLPVFAGVQNDTLGYACQLDAANNIVWEKQYPGFRQLTCITAIPAGAGYWATAIASNFENYGRVSLLRLDAQGNLLFARNFGSGATPEYFTSDINLNAEDGAIISSSQYLPLSIENYIPWVINSDAAGNGFQSGVQGRIWYDLNADCVVNADSIPYSWQVDVWQGANLVASTGHQFNQTYFVPLAPGSYQITTRPPSNGWVICQDTLQVVVQANDTLDQQDFLVRFDPQPIDSFCGALFRDFDGDCLQDAFEPGYEGWPVEFRFWTNFSTDTIVLNATTDANGHFCMTDLQGLTNAYTGAYTGTLDLPGDGLNCHTTCDNFTSIEFVNATAAYIPIGVICDSMPPCPSIEVDIATLQLRPCLPSTYQVKFCNKGAVPASDASVEVQIDEALVVTGASIPWTSAVGNTYTFLLGDLNPEQCGSFAVFVEVPCDDPTGATYCVQAHAFPDTVCNAPGSSWDGSEIAVRAECLGSSVKFTIKNIGSGNMTQAQDYIVIEDNVLLMQSPGSFQLNADEEQEIELPATGSFYRLEAQQSAGFPGMNLPVAWVEGCGDGNNISLGFVNQYTLPDEEPWLDIFCLESVNSYDPNDKNGFPRGYAEEHFVLKNTDIEYVIRFQNTGTAPAINIEIRDTLAVQHLDITSVRPGASSHPYQFDIQGDGVLVFSFPNIYLPDSAQDQAASQGFVKFRVAQLNNLPVNTKILNTAAIYFDNNAPVITNQTLHTIGQDFILLSSFTPVAPEISIQAAPNPSAGLTRLTLRGTEANDVKHLSVWSATGQLMLEATFSGNEFELDAGAFPAGMYWFTLESNGRPAGHGKLVKQTP